MKKFLQFSLITAFISMVSFYTANAAEGDTIYVVSHNKQHMKFPPGARTYTNRTKFPDNAKKFRKILLNYTLGCPASGCSAWDYTTALNILRPTGTFDSTLTQFPHFTVDGVTVDSMHISFDTTYVTFYDATNMITDSTISDTVRFYLYQDANNPTLATDSFYAYNTGYYNYYYDVNGVKIDSIYVNGDSTWYQNYYNVYNVFEVIEKFELARLITPYLGDYYPYTTTFDVTDYAPLLHDSVDVSLVFSGWQDGFTGTIEFAMIEGTPPRDAKRVLPLYHGSFKYGRVSNPIESHLVPTDFDFLSTEKGAILNYTPSGHSFGGNENCAEFCAKNYMVLVNSTQRFKQLMWREDCGSNPLYPQGGTWIYDRANWCPGLEAIRYTHELTSFINFGQPNELDINLDNYVYNGSAAPGTNPDPSYIIDAAVITFDAPNFNLDASVEEILAPNDHILQSRINPICGHPIVRIRNSGATTLTSLIITYGPKDGTKATYAWTGSLDFMQSEVVELPDPDWTPWGGSSLYEVGISAPNGATDEYDQNDVMTTRMAFPDMLPDSFLVRFRTSQGSQNRYYIRDTDNNIIYRNNNPSSNITYDEMVKLDEGCYRFELIDEAGDGFTFFGQGAGYIVFLTPDGKDTLKSFERNFGNEINYQFTVGYNLTGIASNDAELNAFNVYPNPAKNTIYVQFENNDFLGGQLEIYKVTGERVIQKRLNSKSTSIDVAQLSPGMYFYRAITKLADNTGGGRLVIVE